MQKEHWKAWGALWRSQRNYAGLSQQEVAEKLNCQINYISMLERGERFGSKEFREKLAALYGTTLDEMAELLQSSPRLLPSEQKLLQVLRREFSGAELDRACELAVVYLETLTKYIDDMIEK